MNQDSHYTNLNRIRYVLLIPIYRLIFIIINHVEQTFSNLSIGKPMDRKFQAHPRFLLCLQIRRRQSIHQLAPSVEKHSVFQITLIKVSCVDSWQTPRILHLIKVEYLLARWLSLKQFQQLPKGIIHNLQGRNYCTRIINST